MKEIAAPIEVAVETVEEEVHEPVVEETRTELDS